MGKDIVTIGVDVPGQKYHGLGEKLSLQDYELAVFEPTMPNYDWDSFTDGTSAISAYDGKEFMDDVAHWKTELSNALNDGKTIYLFLPDKTTFSVKTGGSETKGKQTNYFTSTYSNYSYLPFSFPGITNASGQKIKYLGHPALTTFWTELEGDLSYKCYFDEPYGIPVFTTRSDRTIGAVKQVGNGYLVILPMLNFHRDVFTQIKDDKEYWTGKALRYGTRFIQHLAEIDKAIRSEFSFTPPPKWAGKMRATQREGRIGEEITKIDEEMTRLITEKEKRQEEFAEVASIKGLLYEKGKPLENAIIDALKLMGFQAEGYGDGTLELDQVIVGPKKDRYIGEAEGKDRHAVNIDKFRQLNNNLDEDFERPEVERRASGILFGNGFRLTEPSMRDTQFTEKCLNNAKRTSTILIQTADMYESTRYLADSPSDAAFKRQCRIAISKSLGEIVKFPVPPDSQTITETKSSENSGVKK